MLVVDSCKASRHTTSFPPYYTAPFPPLPLHTHSAPFPTVSPVRPPALPHAPISISPVSQLLCLSSAALPSHPGPPSFADTSSVCPRVLHACLQGVSTFFCIAVALLTYRSFSSLSSFLDDGAEGRIRSMHIHPGVKRR